MAEETNDGLPEQAENAAHEGAQQGEDWKAKYDELLKQSRKHEDRAKANYEKAKAYDEAARRAEDADGKAGELEKRAEKAEAALAAMKAEREREQAVADAAKKAGVPADVLKLMRGDTAEELKESADALAGYVRSLGLYPEVSDGGAKQSQSVTKESISAIKDRSERVRARAENASLYK